jgi:hypothetical protein
MKGERGNKMPSIENENGDRLILPYLPTASQLLKNTSLQNLARAYREKSRRRRVNQGSSRIQKRTGKAAIRLREDPA